ncbi:riboflavin synthase [Halorussus salilacus]|uniref:riboflavin synthase n=1 Tax=Halorussus salilacus TaxID=2953750 RepID=UPI0020A0BBD5|nr:riboflavin synthase [Halorussus salilacus]USZ69333.1 riboflavin synthase [Halorussus salilacus]
MFTGIVEEAGEVREVTETDDGRRLRISGEEVTADLDRGQSVSVSGVCLTVEDHEPGWFEVFLASETVEKTYLGEVGVGDPVNLERAMAADGRFDGHVVQGHVDATAEVADVRQVGEDWEYAFTVPEGYGRYVVDKGSVTIDGISLTVADRREDAITVAIIPETRRVTNLSEKEPGDPVHLEVDVIAKYAERLLDGAGFEA